MKLRVEKLARFAFVRAKMIADKKGPVSECAGVRIDASDGRMTLRATDLILSYGAEVPASIDEPGAIAVDAKAISDVVSALDDLTVRTTETNRIVLESGASRYTLAGTDAGGFPEVAGPTGATSEVSAAWLGQALAKTWEVASSAELETVKSGVTLAANETTASAFSTDGHRLHRCEFPAGRLKLPCAVTIPRRAAGEIAKMLPSDGDTVAEVTIDAKGDRIWVAHAGQWLGCKLLHRAPIPIDKVIPSEDQVRLTLRVGREVMLEAIKRTLAIGGKGDWAIRLSADAGGQLRLDREADDGRAEESIQAEVVSGDAEAETMINPHYLSHALQLAPSDPTIKICGPLDPFVASAGAFLAVIMPVRG